MCPDGYTSHFSPATSSERAGILKIDLLVHTRGIERLVRSIRVRDRERLFVVGFREFYERTRKRRLLENPEPTVRGSVMGAKGFQSLRVIAALSRRNRRALNGESLGHFRVRSPEMSRWFFSQKPGTGPRRRRQ